MIYPDLTVAENIFIGHRNRGSVVRWRKTYDEAGAILRSLDIDIDPRAQANTLAVAEQQPSRSPRRSPTSPRPDPRRAHGVAVLAPVRPAVRPGRRLRRHGVAVLFISHRLDEVFRPRRPHHGLPRRPAHLDASGTDNHAALGREMVGRAIDDFFVRTRHEPGASVCASRGSAPPALRRRQLRRPRRRGPRPRRPPRLGTHRRRSGPFGTAPGEPGRRRRGHVSSATPATRYARHRLPVPGPRRLGLSMPQPVGENISLPPLRSYRTPFGRRDRAPRERPPGRSGSPAHPHAARRVPVGTLSGGNQQKTLFATG